MVPAMTALMTRSNGHPVSRRTVLAAGLTFDDFASTEHPYMYICHMANHQDGGLMGQFLVVPA